MGTTATFHKGNAIMVRREDKWGRPNFVWRRLTHEERDAWYASDASKGMDSAGESKLPPQDVVHQPAKDELFKVVRSRVTAPRGWGSLKGCCELEDANGTRWYARRSDLY